MGRAERSASRRRRRLLLVFLLLRALHRVTENVLQRIARTLLLFLRAASVFGACPSLACGAGVSRFRRRFVGRRLAAEQRFTQRPSGLSSPCRAQDVAQLVLHDLFERRAEAHARPRTRDAERDAEAGNARVAALAFDRCAPRAARCACRSSARRCSRGPWPSRRTNGLSNRRLSVAATPSGDGEVRGKFGEIGGAACRLTGLAGQ